MGIVYSALPKPSARCGYDLARSTMSLPGRVAVVGEGVVGLSTTLALLEKFPQAQVTVFSDRPFSEITSCAPAGLFRVDKEVNKKFGRLSFARFEEIFKKYPGDVSGVKLLSGHIQSDVKENLIQQEKNFGDIVYNFRWLSPREINGIFEKPSKHCIHYTAFASEGNQYVPFLKNLCLEKGVKFETRKVTNFEELGESFAVVVNCAGLDGGKLSGDDDTVVPSRGVVIELDTPWHKHFNYRDFCTFTIPKNNSVVLGSVKQMGESSKEITDEDRKDIWARYLELHPQMKNAKVLKEWCGLRPERPTVRIEAQTRSTKSGQNFVVLHNYGHGANGFTIGWGTAVYAVNALEEAISGGSAVKSKL